MILFKMVSKNVVREINGCISTGKEANVYHAVNDDEEEFAIKVSHIFNRYIYVIFHFLTCIFLFIFYLFLFYSFSLN